MSKVDELIARTKELDAVATPGPWDARGQGGIMMDGIRDLYTLEAPGVRHLNRFTRNTNGHANAVLIAEYRTLAPKLADMLEYAMAALRQVETIARAGLTPVVVGMYQEVVDEIEAMAEGGEA